MVVVDADDSWLVMQVLMLVTASVQFNVATTVMRTALCCNCPAVYGLELRLLNCQAQSCPFEHELGKCCSGGGLCGQKVPT